MQACDVIPDSIVALLRRKTGLHIRTADQKNALAAIQARMKKCGIRDMDAYLQFVEEDGEQSAAELRELQTQLAVGETYFFRDKGQFLLLETRILPEIIKRRAMDKHIGILSAGCSTGAEPYSVAMLLHRLLSGCDEWKIKITGIDINEEALAHARRGVYDEWMMRSIPEPFKREFFQKKEAGWHLSGAIGKMATFQRADISRESLPDYRNGLYDFDLILCRNLFIYYHSDKVREMAANLAEALVEGGYLMTGHGELLGGEMPLLTPRSYPESVIYQKGLKVPWEMRTEPPPLFKPLPKSVVILPSDHPTHEIPQTPFGNAPLLLKEGRNREAAAAASIALAADPDNGAMLMALGEAQANLGAYDTATEALGKAASLDIHSPRPHWILAHIEETLGNMAGAIGHYEKALYRDPSFIPAYLELASLHENGGDFARAAKTREAAFNLLRSMPMEKRIEPYGHVTAGELALIVEKMAG